MSRSPFDEAMSGYLARLVARLSRTYDSLLSTQGSVFASQLVTLPSLVLASYLARIPNKSQ